MKTFEFNLTNNIGGCAVGAALFIDGDYKVAEATALATEKAKRILGEGAEAEIVRVYW